MQRFLLRKGGPLLVFLVLMPITGCMTPEQAARFQEALSAELERQNQARGNNQDQYDDGDYDDRSYHDDEAYAEEPPRRRVRTRQRQQRKGRTCSQKYPGSFLDVGRRECWQCPRSYPSRTVFPVHGPKACERRGGKHFAKAQGPRRGTGLLKTDCPRGWFFDIGRGRCYRCPNGYKRTVYAVDSNSACVRHTGPSRTRAKYRGTPG